jgi:malonyl-CoA O-methyltransferase
MPMLERARRRGRWLRRPRCLCADLDYLPLADQSVDLVFANAALQWSTRPVETFADIGRVLRPGGLVIFSTFGPDTLRELRAAWAEADGRLRVHDFIDMHDYGDMMMRAGLADPVVDVERMTLTYADAIQLMREIKLIGGANAQRERQRGMLGRQRLAAVCAAYEQFRDADGRLPCSYEVVHGHAWGPAQRRIAGETRVPLDSLQRRR